MLYDKLSFLPETVYGVLGHFHPPDLYCSLRKISETGKPRNYVRIARADILVHVYLSFTVLF